MCIPPSVLKLASTACAAIALATTAPAANILWVSDAAPGSATGGVFSGPGTALTDQGFVTLLQNAGHNVNRFNSHDSQNTNLTALEISAINTNDLIIIGRATGSGAFQQTGTPSAQGSNWNVAVTKPLICMSPFLVRTLAGAGNRMGWFAGDGITDDTPCVLSAVNPGSAATDYLFGGVAMNGTNTVQVYDEIIDRNTSHLPGAPVAGSVILARATYAREDNGAAATGNVIVGFPAGTAVAGGSNVLAGYRMYFAAGSRESATAPNGIPLYTGRENLTASGEDIFLRAVRLAINNGVPPATDPAEPVSVVTQPASAMVGQGGSVTFSVRVTGAAPRTLEWQRDTGDGMTFTNIPNAATTFSGSSITLSNVSNDDNNAHFRVVASNPNNSVTSDSAVLTVTPDTEPPVLLSAVSLDGTTITLCFNEALDGGFPDLTDNFSYTVTDAGNPTLFVDAATLRPDGKSVELTLSGGTPSPEFSLNVLPMNDVFGNPMPAAVDVTVTNLGLTGVNLGALNPVGTNVACAANTIQITGGGLDVGGTADQLRFVYTTVTGDFDARVRVTSLVGVADHLETTAKALLLARENGADANAGSVSAYVTPVTPGDNSSASLVRAVAAGATAALGTAAAPAGLPNGWLRIRRVGNFFTTFRSADGVTWTPFGNTTLAYGPSMAVGLGVTSHRNGKTVTGTFSDFTISSIGPVDVAVTMSGSPDPVAVGGNVTYTISVANLGVDPSTPVTLTDTLPAGVTFVSAASSQGACVEAAGVVTCNLGTLLNGATANITVVVATTGPGSLLNTAVATSGTADSDLLNNTATVTTKAATRPVLAGMTLSGTTASLNVPTETGCSYVVEYKDNLTDALWTTLTTLTGDGTTQTVSDPGPLPTTRFYRVRTP